MLANRQQFQTTQIQTASSIILRYGQISTPVQERLREVQQLCNIATSLSRLTSQSILSLASCLQSQLKQCEDDLKSLKQSISGLGQWHPDMLGVQSILDDHWSETLFEDWH